MSLYKLLHLTPESSYIDVLRRCKQCIDALKSSDHVFKDEMILYVMRVCAVLLDPSGRQCLTYIDQSLKTYTSASKSTLLLKLVSSFHTDIGRKIFHESMLESLTQSSRRDLKFHRFKNSFKTLRNSFSVGGVRHVLKIRTLCIR